MEERMLARFTRPRRGLYIPVRWYARRAWATVKRFAGWLNAHWNCIIGNFIAVVGLLLIWILLPIIAAALV